MCKTFRLNIGKSITKVCHFWLLSEWPAFFGTAMSLAEIGSNWNQTTMVKLNLSKSMIYTVWLLCSLNFRYTKCSYKQVSCVFKWTWIISGWNASGGFYLWKNLQDLSRKPVWDIFLPLCWDCWDCWKNAAAAWAEGARMAWAVVPPDPVVLAGMLPLENIRGVDWVTTGPFQDLKRKSDELTYVVFTKILSRLTFLLKDVCCLVNYFIGQFLVHHFIAFFSRNVRQRKIFPQKSKVREILFGPNFTSKWVFLITFTSFSLDKTSILPKLHRFFTSTISCLYLFWLHGMYYSSSVVYVAIGFGLAHVLCGPSHITLSFAITFLCTGRLLW